MGMVKGTAGISNAEHREFLDHNIAETEAGENRLLADSGLSTKLSCVTAASTLARAFSRHAQS
jgi:hypothetical protein